MHESVALEKNYHYDGDYGNDYPFRVIFGLL